MDASALRRARVSGESCAACHGVPGSVHHVVQRGSPFFGDDVASNLILLCGNGTTGCHGAWHGNPYVTQVEVFGCREWVHQRRDQEWVARRIGETLQSRRRDVITYVLGKLGDAAGHAYLARNYYIEENA